MNATSNNLVRFWPWLAVLVFAALPWLSCDRYMMNRMSAFVV